MIEQIKLEILLTNPIHFEELALQIFQFQSNNCAVYNAYLKNLNIKPATINKAKNIPFLPISFFKTNKVISSISSNYTIFESSGTTGQNTSKHFVVDEDFYKKNSFHIFENYYGSISNYHIIALLPSYFQKGNSSLIFMVKHFIEQSKSPFSGFYNDDFEAIMEVFSKIKNENNEKKILLWGVTYALLDFIEKGFNFSHLKNKLILMETGGMKGRRKEIVKEELYQILKTGFMVDQVYSEYGMTELLSQAYSQSDSLFTCPKQMQIVLREVNDPFATIPRKSKKSGGINIIDLANVDSCSFIETQDLGQYGEKENTFRVLGRFDNSDIRGCNLLVN